ncbi:MAG: hypothetical protein ACTSXQ_03320 [Alphaproteobacteria bacterium]
MKEDQKVVSFPGRNLQATYEKGFNDGFAESMLRSFQSVAPILNKMRHNQWWQVKDICIMAHLSNDNAS